MNRDQAKEDIRNRLEPYLSSKGIQINKNFRCLSGTHPDNNPSMSYHHERNKVHCFSCQADYDIFDLIGVEYGLDKFSDQFNQACSMFGISVDGADEWKPRARVKPAEIPQAATPEEPDTPKADYSKYYLKCHERIGQTDYLKNRGIGDHVIKRFGIGYDPAYKTAGGMWKAVIIPTGVDTYVVRNTDPAATERYRNTGPNKPFNTGALTRSDKPIYIVEGEIDALSVIEAGGEAIALGSTNYKKFIDEVKRNKPAQPLILALDNDNAGRKASSEIAEILNEIGVTYYRLNIFGNHKDANETLLADRDRLAGIIEKVNASPEEAIKEARIKEYMKTSAAAHIKGFMNGIAESVNTPPISTGFSALDHVLDGGLYEGLITMGAVSSLGKTALIMQVADQVAQAGQDVLIFSLEMSRTELMSRSISRHTLLNVYSDPDSYGGMSNAKSARGITDGQRWQQYSQTEQELIMKSVRDYHAYAKHIFISEGLGDISAADIRNTVEKHIEITGNRPIVIVDYLQILAGMPGAKFTTDKMKTDDNVLELKRISRDNKLPLIAISSFNRSNYKAEVSMEAFKESGAVEYTSDVLIALQFEGQGQKDFDSKEAKEQYPREIELVILKNRGGKSYAKVDFKFYPAFSYFRQA